MVWFGYLTLSWGLMSVALAALSVLLTAAAILALSIAAAVEISAWSCHVTFFLAIEMHVGKEVVNSVAVLSVLSGAGGAPPPFVEGTARSSPV